MKWRSKQPTNNEIGDLKIKRIFCWTPFKCDDGYTYWLTYRAEIYEYKRFNYRLPYIKGWEGRLPILKSIGWVKIETLGKIPLVIYRKISVQHIKPPKVTWR